jgi:hypothetical protein
MKKIEIIIATFLLLFTTSVFTSCDDSDVETLVPQITLPMEVINVGYDAGKVTVDVTSNVIYFANVTPGSNWLSYEFSDNCKTLTVAYAENDIATKRTGTIELSKGDKIVTLTVIQEGNPDAGEPQDTEIAFELIEVPQMNGYRIAISAEECMKIPIGATVVFECEGEGSIDGAMLGSSFINIAVSNGQGTLIWTQEIATAAENGINALLFGVTVTRVYIPATPKPVNIEIAFELIYVAQMDGYRLVISPEECAKIPVGAIVVFNCEGEGSIDGAYSGSPLVNVAVSNGRGTLIWTQEIATAAAENGISALLFGITVTEIYVPTPVDVVFELVYVAQMDGYRLVISPEECGKIPIGATVVFECEGEGSINGAYSGSPLVNVAVSNGQGTLIWAEQIAAAAAENSTGISALLFDGVTVTGVYYY